MNTLYLKKNQILQAAKLLKQGGLVSFPTETVYGLGACANNRQACERIFSVKNREPDNPLIVHLSHWNQLEQVAQPLSELEEKILSYFCFSLQWKTKFLNSLSGFSSSTDKNAQGPSHALNDSSYFPHFWPSHLKCIGAPLSLAVLKKETVDPIITAGLSTVCVRFPWHKGTLKLLSMTGPLAAPSANLSGQVSPTHWSMVHHYFHNKIEGVLCDQPSLVGLESTVIQIQASTDSQNSSIIWILRPGAVTPEDLQECLWDYPHPVQIAFARSLGFHTPLFSPPFSSQDKNDQDKNDSGPTVQQTQALKQLRINPLKTFHSPGLKYKHYQPKTPVLAYKNKEQLLEHCLHIAQEKNHPSHGGNRTPKQIGLVVLSLEKPAQEHSVNALDPIEPCPPTWEKVFNHQNISEADQGKLWGAFQIYYSLTEYMQDYYQLLDRWDQKNLAYFLLPWPPLRSSGWALANRLSKTSDSPIPERF